LPDRDVERIENLFQRAGLPTALNLKSFQRAALAAAMQLDKKVSGGEIKFVLARRIGQADFGQTVPASVLEQILCPQPAVSGQTSANP
jgi:3-dehydroquinate synthetase